MSEPTTGSMQSQPTQYVLPANTWTPIPATIFARRVKLTEDGASAMGGIMVKYPNGTIINVPSVDQPLFIGDDVGNNHGHGHFLGVPAQDGANVRAADVYVNVQPMSGQASVLNVWEFD